MAYILQKGISLIIFILLTILFVLLRQQKAFSDGWTISKGSLFITNGISISQFNQINKLTGVGMDGFYNTMSQYMLYLEYGLLDNITLGYKLSASHSMIQSDTNLFSKVKEQNFSLDYSEFFFRTRIFYDENMAISLTNVFKVPGFYNTHLTPFHFAANNYEYEIKLELGYSFIKTDQYINLNTAYNDFFTASLSYRIREDLAWNELRLELTYAYFFAEHIMMILRFQKFNYFIYNEITIGNVFSSLGLGNIGYAKGMISIGYKINPSNVIELGYMRTLEYEFLGTQYNNLDLNGVFVNLWHSF